MDLTMVIVSVVIVGVVTWIVLAGRKECERMNSEKK